jgi:T5SS/PEP-CTERM-associated repeat protein
MHHRLDTPPRRHVLAAALALAFGLGATPSGQAASTDFYWVGQSSNSSSFSSAANWYLGSYTPTVGSPNTATPYAGFLLHFGKGKYTQVNDDISLVSAGLVFDGSLAMTINGSGYLNLSKGIVNTSGLLQTINPGITVGADQVWDGGTGGVTSTGGIDLFDYNLTLSRKVTLDQANLQLGNHSGGNNQTTLTAGGGSQVLLKTYGVIGNGSSPSALYVQDSGSLLRVGTDLTVGNTSDGALHVLSGGTASATNLYMGRVAGTSIVNVSGTGSTLSLSGNLTATQGDLSVASGGQVSFQDAVLGDFALGTVSVNVGGSGASLIAKGSINLGSTGAATLNVQTGGTVQTETLTIGAQGTLNLNGGTLTTQYGNNQGSFNWTAGTLAFKTTGGTGAGTLLGLSSVVGSGQVLQASKLVVEAGSTLGFLGGGLGSIFNMGVAAGGELTVGTGSKLSGGGLVNDGSLLLSGGELQSITTNNAYMSVAGSLSSGWLVNNGLLSQSGAFTLGGTGDSTNNGIWELASGRGLQLVAVALNNAGTLNIGGDTIGGSGRLVNGASGTVSGYGAISAAFSNAGRLVVDGGTMRIAQAFSNPGTVVLNTALATLSGGAITNTGRIEGLGRINNDLANSGTLQARDGTLSLAGTVGNSSSGVLAVGRDATLLVSQGLASNAGKVQLAGGTFDNNGNALTNAATGTISGYGDVRSGAFTNQGRVLLSGGTSAVYADVLGSNASQIILSGNSNTTFYGKVDIQSGAELRVTTGSVATFFEAVQQRSGAKFTGKGAKLYEGGLTVGASPGLGTDEGDVEFGEGNTYLAEIGGTTACTLACGSNDAVKNSSFDKYEVQGQLSFGGTLTLTSWKGFVGQAGQHFDLFDWGSTTGSFASIDASGFKLAAGTQLDTSALYTTGEISVTAVPEPEHWAMLLAGLVGLAWRTRRQRAAQAAA